MHVVLTGFYDQELGPSKLYDLLHCNSGKALDSAVRQNIEQLPAVAAICNAAKMMDSGSGSEFSEKLVEPTYSGDATGIDLAFHLNFTSDLGARYCHSQVFAFDCATIDVY